MASPNTAGQKNNLLRIVSFLKASTDTRGQKKRKSSDGQQMHPKRSAFEITSSAPAESSSGTNHLPYDVFISHHGRDTKYTLASSIYNKLTATGLRVFLDKDELKLGDHFPKVLEAAIAKASLQIAIFSKNYAQSSWCLDEVESMLQTKAIFIPIFYHVEVSDLRWVNEGKGIYVKDFCNYEKKKRYSIQKLQGWKSALKEASFYRGVTK